MQLTLRPLYARLSMSHLTFFPPQSFCRHNSTTKSSFLLYMDAGALWSFNTKGTLLLGSLVRYANALSRLLRGIILE